MHDANQYEVGEQKVIGVYSGKGGVGKSTVASLLALAISKKHKVALVDLDINTPSIPVLFGDRQELPNLNILSLGFGRHDMIDYSGGILRKVVKDLIGKAKKGKPEVIVIDMPPGLNDVHFSLVDFLRPSFFVLVVQPNKLSEEDAKRTSNLFTNLQIPVVGIVQNMSGEVFGEYQSGSVLGLPLIGSIPLSKKIAELGNKGEIDKLKNPIADLADELYEKAGQAEWKLINRSLFEGLTYEELVTDKELPDLDTEEGRDEFKRMRKSKFNPFSITSASQLQFMGLRSWDQIREHLMNIQGSVISSQVDHTLLMNDEATIRQMVYSLDDGNSGLFMIVRPPNTAIPLFPGEVGVAHLYTEGKHYYGIPRVAYQTDRGEVVLFPHEIKPITIDSLNQYLEEKTLILATNSKIPRYIPTKENIVAIKQTFGDRVFLISTWERNHEELCGKVTE